MAYNQFTLPRVLADFGLTLDSAPDLFPGVPPVPIPAHLRATLASNAPLAAAISTELARGQLLTGPLVAEVWRAGGGRVALYIGTRFDVDDAAGLTGACDYILSRPPQAYFVSAPVMLIAEAKNDDIWAGVGPCAAGMVAARRFNQGRNPDIGTIYGAVSDGVRWRLLRLAEPVLTVELGDRLIADVDQVFGILLHICGIAPTPGGP